MKEQKHSQSQAGRESQQRMKGSTNLTYNSLTKVASGCAKMFPSERPTTLKQQETRKQEDRGQKWFLALELKPEIAIFFHHMSQEF